MFKKLIYSVVCLSLITPQIHAAQGENPMIVKGDSAGHGTDPILALTPEQQAEVKANYNLDYLKLTPQQIAERDKKLSVVYSSYQNSNVSQVINALEKTFGMNIYQHYEQNIDFTRGRRVEKKDVMAAATRFFVDGRYMSSDTYFADSPFRQTLDNELGFRDSISIRTNQISLRKIEGSDNYFNDTKIIQSPYDLITITPTAYHYHSFFPDSKRKGLFTTTQDNLFQHPAIINLTDAMRELNLRGLDATVVFLSTTLSHLETVSETKDYSKFSYKFVLDKSKNWQAVTDNYYYDRVKREVVEHLPKVPGQPDKTNLVINFDSDERVLVDYTWIASQQAYDVTVKYQKDKKVDVSDASKVVYPTFSRLAPIPQPVVYISKTATKADLVKMLSEHAPRIYAFNKLFDQQVLPSVQELYSYLDQYPNFMAEVRRLKGNVSRENAALALQQAFLTVTYGTLAGVGIVAGTALAVAAAPYTLGWMLASPAYCHLLATTTVVIIH